MSLSEKSSKVKRQIMSRAWEEIESKNLSHRSSEANNIMIKHFKSSDKSDFILIINALERIRSLLEKNPEIVNLYNEYCELEEERQDLRSLSYESTKNLKSIEEIEEDGCKYFQEICNFEEILSIYFFDLFDHVEEEKIKDNKLLYTTFKAFATATELADETFKQLKSKFGLKSKSGIIHLYNELKELSDVSESPKKFIAFKEAYENIIIADAIDKFTSQPISDISPLDVENFAALLATTFNLGNPSDLEQMLIRTMIEKNKDFYGEDFFYNMIDHAVSGSFGSSQENCIIAEKLHRCFKEVPLEVIEVRMRDAIEKKTNAD